MTTRTPNFTGWRAVILSEADGNTDRLCRQLGLLGIAVSIQWTPLAAADLPDLVLIDADRGWDELLLFSDAAPACPVVALLGSEAPGRISFALRHGAGAIISKPVAASAVYPALVLAVSIHAERVEARRRIDHLEERLKLRPIVFAAIVRLKAERHIDDEKAYAILRDCAMRRRMPIEQLAAFFLGGSETLREVG
ncbi:ANTAR domain-containing protein [Shinella curvata]|uniref:ANTAR domain-containing protein n=1 Tax=Shinella curvata TaxID=1817964 RepID=A0ABT8XAM5_9HYPH|nr:ANTAR domain-containing protein [Shinella curvata]MCJ8054912.1 ANTAR domain-containing protein [Shinella curvata]MDO6120692.1 ANTAR domain-containing protein [Shinella curvata]